MGALIPIGGGADAELKDKLNKRFSGNNINDLRNHRRNTGENLFDSNHSLHRVAWRLRCYPTNVYGHDAKGKWFYFLHRTLPAADDGTGVRTADAIKIVLNRATDPNDSVTAVNFDAQEDPNARCHYVLPDNANPGIRVGNTYNLILVCPAPLSNNNEHAPDQPSDADTHAGHSVESPPVQWPPLARAEGRRSRGKSVKKAKKSRTTKRKKSKGRRARR